MIDILVKLVIISLILVPWVKSHTYNAAAVTPTSEFIGFKIGGYFFGFKKKGVAVFTALTLVGTLIFTVKVMGYIPFWGDDYVLKCVEKYTDHDIFRVYYTFPSAVYVCEKAENDQSPLFYRLQTDTIPDSEKLTQLENDIRNMFTENVVPVLPANLLHIGSDYISSTFKLDSGEERISNFNMGLFISSDNLTLSESEKMPAKIATIVMEAMGDTYNLTRGVTLKYRDNNGEFHLRTYNVDWLFHSYERDTIRYR